MAKAPIYLVNQRGEHSRHTAPMGLMYVGAALEDAGFRVKILILEGQGDRRLEDEVLAERPLFVGFSTFVSDSLAHDIRLSRWVHAQGVPVVWGGVFPSALPEEALAAESIDYIVMGEGERAAVALAAALESGEKPAGVAGVGYREGDGIVLHPPAPREPEIDRFRFGYQMVDWDKFITFDPRDGTRTAWVPFSRGCPFRCRFCYNNIDAERRIWRPHGADYIKEIIEYLKAKHGINRVFLTNDNAFGKVARAQKIIEALDIPWMTPTTISIITENFLDWARDTRCQGLGFGLESGSARMLKLLGKSHRPEVIPDRIALCRKKGIHSSSSWMILILGETKEDLRQTIEMVEKVRSIQPTHIAFLTLFRLYPKTPIWDDAIEQGFIPPKNMDEWASYKKEAYPLLGYSDRQAHRLKFLLERLYPIDRTADRIIPNWIRPFFRRRLFRAEFNWPIEAAARVGWRVAKKLKRLTASGG